MASTLYMQYIADRDQIERFSKISFLVSDTNKLAKDLMSLKSSGATVNTKDIEQL